MLTFCSTAPTLHTFSAVFPPRKLGSRDRETMGHTRNKGESQGITGDDVPNVYSVLVWLFICIDGLILFLFIDVGMYVLSPRVTGAYMNTFWVLGDLLFKR